MLDGVPGSGCFLLRFRHENINIFNITTSITSFTNTEVQPGLDINTGTGTFDVCI
jgi:hypothetical protein